MSGGRPRVFVSYAHDSEQHKRLVLKFATFVRESGIDVHLDQWDDDRRRDWSLWAVEQVMKAEFVLVIASAAYKHRAEYGVARDEGRGVQFEASLLRELLCEDREHWLPRLLPVVLPGRSVAEIPLYFQPRTADHYLVGDFTEDGAANLLATLRNRSLWAARDSEPVAAPVPIQPLDVPDVQLSLGDPAQDDLVDDLARTVEAQWRHQQEQRSLLAAPLLRVRWSVTADAEAAMAGVSNESLGLVEPRSLAGDLSEAGRLIGRLPSRRLVVLGSAGAGKSVFAIRLIEDLLVARRAGDPVPVLLPMGDWNPGTQRLPDWMAERLIQDHPGLRRKVRSAAGETRTLAASLVGSGRILPILDGLDEVNEALRPAAIGAINRLGSGLPLIVTSRVEEYLRAVEAAEHGLLATVAVELHPLEMSQVQDYLLAERKPVDRWRPVVRELRENPQGPLAQVLRTPLMAWLARTIYSDPATSPQELCQLDDSDAVADHLLDHLVGAAYPSYPLPATGTAVFRTVDKADVEAWLGFLARHLQSIDSTELAWWRLHRTMRPMAPMCRYVVGAMLGFGLGQIAGTTTGLVLGCLFTGPMMMSRRFLRWSKATDLETPHMLQFSNQRVRGDLRGLRRSFTNGLGLIVMGIAVVLAGMTTALLPRLALAALFLLGLGRTVWVGLHPTPMEPGTEDVADLGRVTEPARLLRADRATALVGVIPFVALAAVFLLAGVPSLAVCFIACGVATIIGSAWFRFIVTRFVLALRGRLPWRTMTFLADARDRGVLRQLGATYQFRHARLRDRLAGMSAGGPGMPRRP